MACSKRAEDVQFALQRAKTKISNLQQLSNKSERLNVPERLVKNSHTTWMVSEELRDTLVDMYSANPGVNVELRQRFPSEQLSSRSGTSPTCSDWLQDPQLLQRCSAPPLGQKTRVFTASLLTSRPPGGAGEMEVDLFPSRGPESCSDGAGGPAVPSQVISIDDSCRQDDVMVPLTASSPVQSFDRDRNISFLLKELDALRDVNKKLLDRLVQKEKELQRKEVEEELREEQREARGWERPAAVLEELLAAQKDRDQALMSRLRLANEERDEATLHARQVQQTTEMENVHLEDSDMDVDELLRCVCDANSVHEVEQFGSVLLQRLQLARQRRHDITAQEMKAVIEERDESVSKCKRLEQDLVREREQRASEDDLLKLQGDRGGALEDSGQPEAELQLKHSSQDLLTPPRSHPTDEGSPAGRAPVLQAPLLVQVQKLSKEKQSVEAELQRCQEAEREARERVRRLERLVDVLRKKVGTGSLRAVI